jgi:bacteriorhodopsin
MATLFWMGAAGFGLGAALLAWLSREFRGRARMAGVIVYWGRFADGLTNIPLFVLLLALLADADRTTTATGMAVGGYTMLATLLATVTTGTAKFAWLAVALGAFCALLWVLFGPLGRAAATADRAALFSRTRLLVVALFSLYPVLWLLGEPGFALAPGEWLVPARLAVDMALKIGVPLSVVTSDALQSSSASDASSASS